MEPKIITAITPIISSDAYVTEGGSKCPYCGSVGIEGHSLEFEGGSISQEISCNDCHKRWYDVYNLMYYEEILNEQKL